ncbi:MAG: OmpA family protein [Ignavibacteriaceae bacterium]
MRFAVVFIGIVFLFVSNSQAQIDLKKILKKTKDKTEKKIESKIEKKIDDTVDDVLEGNIGDGEEESGNSKDQNEGNETQSKNNINPKDETQKKVSWNKYDFVPGDIVIFEDNLEGEKNGEFPSKWDLTKGNIEVATFNEENVIYFIKCNTNGGGGIVPLLKNSSEDYLPEEFTVEFDAFFESASSYTLYLTDYKNQKKLDKTTPQNDKWLRFNQNSARGDNINTGYYPGTSGKDIKAINSWRHFAISFNKRALKVYLDDARVINIPNLGYEPTGITLGFHNPGGNSKGYVKNIRIAKGAVPLYDKFLTNGRIVTNGIKFDINKSTIKPESYGVINEIVKILKENPDLRFSVEGHTDNDGDEKANQKLSEERSKSVIVKMVELGIASDRLTAKGFGESKPIDSNLTSEGKANNRRVEFVKI